MMASKDPLWPGMYTGVSSEFLTSGHESPVHSEDAINRSDEARSSWNGYRLGGVPSSRWMM